MSCTDPSHQYLAKRCEALEKRNQFLTERLAQRYSATIHKYDGDNFSTMRDLALKVFLEAGPETMLTMKEAVEEFRRMFPNVNYTNVDRRIMELSEPSGKFGRKLGRRQEQDGSVRYYLMLDDVGLVANHTDAEVRGAVAMLNGVRI